MVPEKWIKKTSGSWCEAMMVKGARKKWSGGGQKFPGQKGLGRMKRDGSFFP